MGGRLVFDVETDGFLEKLSVLHSLVILDIDSGDYWNCCDQEGYSKIEEGLKALQDADQIIGHNIIKFDLPAIQKIYPWFTYRQEQVVDTLTLSRLIWTNLVDTDMTNVRKGKTTLPAKLAGGHSLEAWGHRLGEWKGDYAKMMQDKGLDPWTSWNEDMQSYCEQDVAVSVLFYELCESKDYSQVAIDLEHAVAFILAEQERNGFRFDTPAAEKLYAQLLAKKAELNDELQAIFEPWVVDLGEFIPKRPNKKLGYTGTYTEVNGERVFVGDPVRKTKTVVFNPNSRDHIAYCLKDKYKWKPKELTPSGKAKVDETVLSKLPYPEATQLADYMLLAKRIGQLAEGRMAWLSKVEDDGRIHGGIIPNGAVTGRATHSNPNIGQVPSVGALYGKECRSLFTATPGKTGLLGCDVSGLELRMLGHFMAKHDDGAYGKEVIEGDPHSLNAALLMSKSLDIYMRGRKDQGLLVDSIFYGSPHARKWGKTRPDLAEVTVATYCGFFREKVAKTFMYAFLYGAGAVKLGSLLLGGAKEGTKAKNDLLKGLPALAKLINGVVGTAERRGYLVGLDGRHLHVRSPHSALNTLLQSAGALVCKQWMVEFHRLLRERGLADHVKQVAWVHDELQMEVEHCQIVSCNEEKTSRVGEVCVEAIAEAGKVLGIRVPLTGEYKIGRNWAETH